MFAIPGIAVHAALAHYTSYPGEVDAWIAGTEVISDAPNRPGGGSRNCWGERDTETLLLDEMFAPVPVGRLCVEGFGVVAVARHATLRAASDEEVMWWTTIQGHRLVTENVTDFLPLIPSPLLDALRRRPSQTTDHAGPVAWLS